MSLSLSTVKRRMCTMQITEDIVTMVTTRGAANNKTYLPWLPPGVLPSENCNCELPGDESCKIKYIIKIFTC